MSNKNLRNKITICCAIFLWTVGAQASTLPPDPDNAALLYYQAFLLRPEPDTAAKELVYKTRLETIDKLLRGGELETIADTEKRIRQLEKMFKDIGVELKPGVVTKELIQELKERLKNRDAEPDEKIFDPNTDVMYLMRYNLLREQYESRRSVDPNEKIPDPRTHVLY
ncbi:MAG: hypothetical protein ACETWQ_03490 [Phycisphaerae bacterium]